MKTLILLILLSTSIQADNSAWPYHVVVYADHTKMANLVPEDREAPEVRMHQYFSEHKYMLKNGTALRFEVYFRDDFNAHYDKYSCVMDGEIILVINQTNCYEFKDK